MEYNYIDQKEQWRQDRLGRFTSSQIHKLMQGGRKKDEYFGQGAQTYIRQKAAELLTNLPVGEPPEGMVAMEWGLSNEPLAVQEFENRYNIKVEYYGRANPLFFPYSDYSGGSPDAMIDAVTGIEIKCPYNSGEHVNHLLIETAEELYAEIPRYYWQCMANMLFTSAKHWCFISYDPRFPIEEFQLKMIDIPINETHINELKERIQKAEKELALIVQKLQVRIKNKEVRI